MTTLRKTWHTAKFALALTACIASFEARAAYTCTLSLTAISTVYSPTVATPNDSTGTYTVSCTRLATDANAMNYTLEADNGLPPGGRQVRLAGNQYTYQLYRNAAFTQLWGTTGATDIAGTVNFGTSLTANDSGPFYMRVPGSQPVVPAGTYTDTVNVTLFKPGPNATAALSLSVITTNSCQISTPPGNVDFTYTSFQVAAAVASTTFGARCTTALPYTMALDATSGTLLGLIYTLALSTPSATGTGVVQTHSINGSIAAGQAGTCAVASCVGSQTRTLTISW